MKPTFLLSKSIVLKQYNTAKALADLVSYSSKTNQDVTKVLEKETDSMFSVHFENELKHVQDFSRVLFLAQAWSKEKIMSLYNKGIRWFCVDNESDLDIFLEWVNNNDVTINLLLRLKIRENSIRTERYFVFGMNSEVINKRIQEIQESNNREKITNLGIHFHRKTQNMAEWNYKYELTQTLEKQTLQAINYLNIGGGLPSEYANTNMNVMQSIKTKINELREWLAQNSIKLILEPGRFIAAPACRLQTQIIGIHENNIIVNASVYNSDMDAIIVPVKLLIEGELPKGEGQAYVVKGITPCSLDLFRYRVYLNEPQVGDTLTFLNAGAYNFSTDFCDLERIEVRVVE